MRLRVSKECPGVSPARVGHGYVKPWRVSVLLSCQYMPAHPHPDSNLSLCTQSHWLSPITLAGILAQLPYLLKMVAGLVSNLSCA